MVPWFHPASPTMRFTRRAAPLLPRIARLAAPRPPAPPASQPWAELPDERHGPEDDCHSRVMDMVASGALLTVR